MVSNSVICQFCLLWPNNLEYELCHYTKSWPNHTCWPMSKIAVSLDKSCLIVWVINENCNAFGKSRWMFKLLTRGDPQIQGRSSLLRSFTYIGLSPGRGLICLVLFGIWMKILHWGFFDRSFGKSSSMYLSSDLDIYKAGAFSICYSMYHDYFSIA